MYEQIIRDARSALSEATLKTVVEKRDLFSILRIENIGVLRIYDSKNPHIDYSQIPEHFKKRIMDIVEPLSDEVVLGVDEAGKGDFFGPLVIAGVIVRNPSEFRALGVTDSKRLKDEKILVLSKEIKKQCLTNIVKLGPEKYNEMYSHVRNLNRILAWGHATAIENILKLDKPDYVISDKFADESVLRAKLMEKGKKVRLVQRTHAESNISVAASSIVARAEFVLAIQRMSFKYGMELPLGAGKSVIEAARKFADKHGTEELRKVCKTHFRTYADVKD